MKTSLIITTYNWPEALELVLLSVKNQTSLPSEVIIADDGSKEDTRALIHVFKQDFPVPLVHVWHEDRGFKKSEILNKTIAKACGDYIIQIDGDCIIHPNFIKDHLDFSKSNTFLYGSRVGIKKRHLTNLFNNKQTSFNPFSKGIKKRTRAIYLPFLSLFYGTSDQFSSKYRGCNTSYFKKDAIAVNGYNEDFTGWGREDSEFALRLINKGIKSRRLRYRGIVYHIFHHEESKARLTINNQIEMDTITNNIIWCENGINKYLKDTSEN